MDLKVSICLCFFFVGVFSQFGVKTIINQTQYLQQVERNGVNYTNSSERHHNLYPQLSNLTDGHYGQSNESHFYPRNQHDDIHHQQPYNATEKFLNKTVSSMAKGVCIKEVPTTSLLKRNEVFVAGNGSDPTLSRIQVCCEGYQRNVHNFRKCDPICRMECVNGFCSAPDTCNCFPDHVRNLAGFCLPTCPIMCGNGFCNHDNTCTCDKGFVLEQNGKFCVPRCSGGCHNGNCTAPEECTCDKGFSISANGRCEPVCSNGCKNGDCVATNVCNCHKGFSKVEGVCQPICSRGCTNGICVTPEVCECSENGWSLDSTGSQCVASCDKPCLNGVCSGPNQCTCRSGFALDVFDPFRCIPRCEPPCDNGVCSGPNMCLCYQGYVKDRSVKGSQKCVRA